MWCHTACPPHARPASRPHGAQACTVGLPASGPPGLACRCFTHPEAQSAVPTVVTWGVSGPAQDQSTPAGRGSILKDPVGSSRAPTGGSHINSRCAEVNCGSQALLVVRPAKEERILHFSMEVTGTQASVPVNKGFLALLPALPGLLSSTGIPAALTAFQTGPPTDSRAPARRGARPQVRIWFLHPAALQTGVSGGVAFTPMT